MSCSIGLNPGDRHMLVSNYTWGQETSARLTQLDQQHDTDGAHQRLCVLMCTCMHSVSPGHIFRPQFGAFLFDYLLSTSPCSNKVAIAPTFLTAKGQHSFDRA